MTYADIVVLGKSHVNPCRRKTIQMFDLCDFSVAHSGQKTTSFLIQKEEKIQVLI